MFSKLFTVLLLWLQEFPGTTGGSVVLQGGELDSFSQRLRRKQKDVILRDLKSALLQPPNVVGG